MTLKKGDNNTNAKEYDTGNNVQIKPISVGGWFTPYGTQVAYPIGGTRNTASGLISSTIALNPSNQLGKITIFFHTSMDCITNYDVWVLYTKAS